MPDHPAYRHDAPRLPAHDPRPGDPCERCGQHRTTGERTVCDVCRTAERAAVNACEQLPMFTPAPAPMPGQLTL